MRPGASGPGAIPIRAAAAPCGRRQPPTAWPQLAQNFAPGCELRPQPVQKALLARASRSWRRTSLPLPAPPQEAHAAAGAAPGAALGAAPACLLGGRGLHRVGDPERVRDAADGARGGRAGLLRFPRLELLAARRVLLAEPGGHVEVGDAHDRRQDWHSAKLTFTSAQRLLELVVGQRVPIAAGHRGRARTLCRVRVRAARAARTVDGTTGDSREALTVHHDPRAVPARGAFPPRGRFPCRGARCLPGGSGAPGVGVAGVGAVVWARTPRMATIRRGSRSSMAHILRAGT